jgi:hypothetical protein
MIIGSIRLRESESPQKDRQQIHQKANRQLSEITWYYPILVRLQDEGYIDILGRWTVSYVIENRSTTLNFVRS